VGSPPGIGLLIPQREEIEGDPDSDDFHPLQLPCKSAWNFHDDSRELDSHKGDSLIFRN
jgi:hypothetical protein